MAKRASSSSDILLGLLAIEPMSGYDLGMTIRASVGHFWSESHGQIYSNLKAGCGMCDCKNRTPQRQARSGRIYSVTRKGQDRLAKWLAVPPQPEIPRNELLLKLFFGDKVPAEVLYRLCRAHARK